MPIQYNNNFNPYALDDLVEDGIYVIPDPDPRQFRVRDMIEKVKELGRPLTDEEAEEFVIEGEFFK